MPEERVYAALMGIGISRRDFLKFCFLASGAWARTSVIILTQTGVCD
jgi:hypothetical protein